MTPEERQRLNALESQIKELMSWVEQKKVQQISLPLDSASADIIIDATA